MEKPKTPYYLPFDQEITVVIRDDGPLAICQSRPSYRSVKIKLTPQQVKLLALFYTHHLGNAWHHETIDSCFFEMVKTET